MQNKFKLIFIGLALLLFTGLSLALPGPVMGLDETDTGETWILWEWTNPADPDFNEINVYIDGSQVATLSNTTTSYNATGLSPSTSYEISTITTDFNGSSDAASWINDSATTSAPAGDTTPPGPVSGLSETDTGETWILWGWTNPADSDFNNTNIYIDDVQVATLSNTSTSYNATGLSSGSSYTIGIQTQDLSGNIGDWTNDSATTSAPAGDTTSPGPVSDLSETDTGETWILWGWTNPADSDFNNTNIYIDDVQVATLSNTSTSYNATGLSSGSSYTIGIQTQDLSGNIGDWANDSATTDSSGPDTTAPEGVTSLEVDEKGVDWIQWTWTNPASDFNHSMVYINDDFIGNVSNNYYNATNLSSSTSYTIKLHTVDGSGNINTTDVTNTTSTYSNTYYWGNRIWDENGNMSKDHYTWDARSFSGFFYDLDTGENSETMTIYDIDGNIDEGDLEYTTVPITTDFEYEDWGEYQVIGFMAEKYFAGYIDSNSWDDDISVMSDGILAKVLLDEDDRQSFYTGSSLELEDGYALNIQEIDVNGDNVWLSLTKNGDEVDNNVLKSGGTFVYEKDLGSVDDVPIVAVHIDNVFSGQTSNSVFVDGIFQISDDYVEIGTGDEFGEMEIKTVNDNKIVMKNEDSIGLDEGDTINIMGNLNIIVAEDDDSVLRFAPYVDMSDPGIYELRGTIATEDDDTFIWTPLNFEGFYYDIDEGMGSESLTITSSGGRDLEDDDIIYTAEPVEVSFEYEDWGEYQVIGFMAEKYFAGYIDDSSNDWDDDISLMSEGQLAKVLIDDDDKRTISSGSSLILEEGYALNIKEVDVNGDQVMIELTKNGDEVDTDTVSSNSDYTYEKDIGGADDVPLIVVHFDRVFSGIENTAVFVNGIFQISDDYVEIERGEDYGAMTIDAVGDDHIVMNLEDDVGLDEGDTIELMGNIQIRVADDSTLRYYPFIEVEPDSSGSLSLDIDPDSILEGEEVTFTVTSRGSSVEDVLILVGNTEAGKTDSEGTLEYEFDDSGTYTVTAEKTGFVSDTGKVEVLSPEDENKKITIKVSPEEIFAGSPITISVLKAIGSDPIEDAEVYLDGKLIGETDENGILSYTPRESGTHKIKASSSGMLDSELNIQVQEMAANFVFSDFQFSSNPAKVNKEVTVSLNAVNNGDAEGNYTVELFVNNEIEDSEEIALGINNSTAVELSFTPEAEGTYFVEAGGLSDTLAVEKGTSVIWYVAGIGVLALAGGAIYLYAKGGTAGLNSAIESIKGSVNDAIGKLKK